MIWLVPLASQAVSYVTPQSNTMTWSLLSTQNSPRIFPISNHNFKAYCLITMNIYSFLYSTFFLFDTSIFTLEIKSLNNFNSPLNNIGVNKMEERQEEVCHYYINYKKTQTIIWNHGLKCQLNFLVTLATTFINYMNHTMWKMTVGKFWGENIYITLFWNLKTVM